MVVWSLHIKKKFLIIYFHYKTKNREIKVVQSLTKKKKGTLRRTKQRSIYRSK